MVCDDGSLRRVARNSPMMLASGPSGVRLHAARGVDPCLLAARAGPPCDRSAPDRVPNAERAVVAHASAAKFAGAQSAGAGARVLHGSCAERSRRAEPSPQARRPAALLGRRDQAASEAADSAAIGFWGRSCLTDVAGLQG